jgi:putative thioredoxin
MAKPEMTDVDILAVRAALALADAGGGEAESLKRRVAADPADLDARFELAGAMAAEGDFVGAADQLLAILTVDRGWKDGLAKTQLLTVFEAAGPGSEVTRAGRRKLSSLLFA